jgi:hypothetical protein
MLKQIWPVIFIISRICLLCPDHALLGQWTGILPQAALLAGSRFIPANVLSGGIR